MKLLLFSDLHLLLTKKDSFQSEFSNHFKKHIARISPDQLIFCGDILDKGAGDYTDQVDRYVKELNINHSNLILTCGNHDIDRESLSTMFIEHADGFKNNEQLNSFVSNPESIDFKNSINHIEFFNEYLNKNCHDLKECSSLYYIKEIIFGNKTINIVSINTAWFFKNIDQNNVNILYPVDIMREIINKIKKSDIKILVSHFPIEYLKEFNRIEVEKIISKYFDISLTGHIHRVTKSSIYNCGDGYFKCSTPAMLEQENPEYSGFVTLDIDVESYKVKISEYNYFMDEFHETRSIEENIPVEEEKKKLISLNKSIRNAYENELEIANTKFLLHDDGNLCFEDIFNEPVLREKREIDSLKNRSRELDLDNKNLHSSDLITNGNILVYGNDKSGKTMLLTKVLLEYFKISSSTKTVPLYIDFTSYYGKNEKLILKNIISKYYNVSGKDYAFLIENYGIKLIIDNFRPNYETVNNLFFEQCKEFGNVSFLFSVKSTMNYTPKLKIDHIEYSELFIHNIKRKQVRELTNKWPLITDTKKEDVFNKIVDLFSQLNIHFNYWTVSMFLWIFEKTSDINIHNDIELLDIYIENLLERNSLALNNSSFSYDNLKDFLGYFSYYLYNNCEVQNYRVSYADLINIYEDFKKGNIRIVADSKEVLDYLLEKGILISFNDGLYTFRLNGVFEFFLAHYMDNDESFFNKIISDSQIFLSFENELQIYAGLNRNKSTLLQHIFVITLCAHDLLLKLNPHFSESKQENEYQHFISESLSRIVKDTEVLIQPLEELKKDEFNDMFNPLGTIDSGVKIKTKYNIEEIDVELFNKHLFILARILRNTDSIRDEELVQEIFSYILEMSCLTPQYLLFEFEDSQSLFSDEVSDDYIDFIESYSPIIIHTFLFDALSHKNMRSIILKNIEIELAKDSPDSTKLFVMYFLVIETDIENEVDLIDDLLNNLHESYIQHSIFLKLIMMMYFKVSKGSSAEKKLRKQIIAINKRVNPSDKGSKILQKLDKGKIKKAIYEE